MWSRIEEQRELVDFYHTILALPNRLSEAVQYLVGLLSYIRVRERLTISGIFQPWFWEVVAGFSATVGIVLRLSLSGIFLHIEGIEPAVIMLMISLLRQYPMEPPFRGSTIVQDIQQLCTSDSTYVLLVHGAYNWWSLKIKEVIAQSVELEDSLGKRLY